ncbi:hypothetical protein F7Q99_38295 [Streptomyces kaniharaensis]|uniref:DUF4129 domain-containing protein n=1 Tax=Streptomyces kaniharaensis TaxID=212423 RepID=A0A6N7L1M7_9ACTN|nr:hypothetical protein [Streptomyces kaniharaensis]MQS17886.1 hypothetical protein [Streptomyces kaniharaensis]
MNEAARHGLQARDPDPEIDREFQAHALDAAQLADAARHYAARLIYGVRPEDADHLAALAARLSRQARRIDGMRAIARRPQQPTT